MESRRLDPVKSPDWKPLITAGTVLGLGMGGFLDGIVAHQILQIHNMMSNRVFPDTLVNAEINMFWDGLFHAFTWLTTLLGVGLLWRAIKHVAVPLSGKALVFAMLLGWGIFNLVEGIIDHHLLELHHVVQRAAGSRQTLFDLAFLASGVILIAVGGMGIRRSQGGYGASRPDSARLSTVPIRPEHGPAHGL